VLLCWTALGVSLRQCVWTHRYPEVSARQPKTCQLYRTRYMSALPASLRPSRSAPVASSSLSTRRNCGKPDNFTNTFCNLQIYGCKLNAKCCLLMWFSEMDSKLNLNKTTVCNIYTFLCEYIDKCNISLLQSSVSHDHSQFTLKWGSDDQETFMIIINVETVNIFKLRFFEMS